MPRPEVRFLHHVDPAELRVRARRALRQCELRSRSYRDPHAVVAGWTGRVGVDLEQVGPLDRAFGESIVTPDERAAFSARLDDPAFLSLLWSGKEAAAKCLGDAVAYDPRRLDAPLLWDHLDGIYSAGRLRAVPLDAPVGHVGWVVWEIA